MEGSWKAHPYVVQHQVHSGEEGAVPPIYGRGRMHALSRWEEVHPGEEGAVPRADGEHVARARARLEEHELSHAHVLRQHLV